MGTLPGSRAKFGHLISSGSTSSAQPYLLGRHSFMLASALIGAQKPANTTKHLSATAFVGALAPLNLTTDILKNASETLAPPHTTSGTLHQRSYSRLQSLSALVFLASSNKPSARNRTARESNGTLATSTELNRPPSSSPNLTDQSTRALNQQPWYQPEDAWHQPQDAWHQPQGAWHQPQEAWHQPQGASHQTQGAFHQTQGVWHQPQQ
jgi:hypothetical protein